MCASAWFKYNNKDCFDCILKNPIYSLFRRCYQNSFLKTLPLFFRNRKGVDSPLLHQNATHIVLNQQGATFLNKLLPDLKVRVVPNFSAIASDSKKIKTELYFCYVGRLSHEKGFCNLISNWPEGVKLKVVGSGECETCGKSSTENSLIEFVGLKAQGETREIISGATGLVVPSQNSEGIPTVILEAISCGTPLILSEMMHVSEELVQSKVGYQVPADFNSEIMLTAIQCVIANYEVFSKNAFNLHDQKFSQSIWLTLIESAYREVANAAKP
jgi:glycosyltransferase involved in cell wall biosynthesis